MSIQLTVPPKRELKPRIVVLGVGGAGGNAVNNMIAAGLEGVDFVVANTDAQALSNSSADRRIQIGNKLTEGLGAGSDPEVGRLAAEETMVEIVDMLQGAHMAFVTAGMGGGTGTGAAPIIARAAREQDILTVGVITTPFDFEGVRRMRSAVSGINELAKEVDTLIIIPNQNLFRIANAQTTFAEAFAMADEVLHSGVAGITDLMVKPGLINLDFADVRTVMNEMGKAMMGTGDAEGETRAIEAAEAAIANPLLDDVSMRGARGVLINITGGDDMTLYEVDEAANRIKDEVDAEANIIIGSTFDENLKGSIRVSVVATGIDAEVQGEPHPADIGQVIALTPTGLTPAERSVKTAIDPVVPAAPPAEVALQEVGEAFVNEPEILPEIPKKDVVAGQLPGYLRDKPMVAPRQEMPKRSRSFIDRVFGRKKADHEQSGAEQSGATSSDMPLSQALAAAEPSVGAPSSVPQASSASQTVNILASAAFNAELDGPALEPIKVVDETQNRPVMQTEAAVRARAEQNLVGAKTIVPAVSVSSEGLPDMISDTMLDGGPDGLSEAVVKPDAVDPVRGRQGEAAPTVQTTMQTSMQTEPDLSDLSFEIDQLDIPAFLRR